MDEKLPSHVEEADLFRLQLKQERVIRLKTEAQLFNLKVQKAVAEAQAVEKAIAEKYKVTPQDEVDGETGLITRAGDFIKKA